MLLDDYDVMTALKMWTQHDDKILRLLSSKLLNRNLFRCLILNDMPSDKNINEIEKKILKKFAIDRDDLSFLMNIRPIENLSYSLQDNQINLVYKNSEIKDISQVSNQLNLDVLSMDTTKYFLLYPKEIEK